MNEPQPPTRRRRSLTITCPMEEVFPNEIKLGDQIWYTTKQRGTRTVEMFDGHGPFTVRNNDVTGQFALMNQSMVVFDLDKIKDHCCFWRLKLE